MAADQTFAQLPCELIQVNAAVEFAKAGALCALAPAVPIA
jgi:hypothetical protein